MKRKSLSELLGSSSKFQAINPDILPVGRHTVKVSEVGWKVTHETPETLAKIASEIGYTDRYPQLRVVFTNDKGRIVRDFPILGFFKFSKAQEDMLFHVSQVDPAVLNITASKWKKMNVEQQFLAAYTASTDQAGYLVFKDPSGFWRPVNEHTTNACQSILQKFVGACDPSYERDMKSGETIEDHYFNIVRDQLGKELIIKITEDEYGNKDVTRSFATA